MARILLAEESPAERALVRKTLLASGHSIIEAASAAETLERLSDEPVDVIVLDTAMPDASAEEVVDAIRTNPDWALIPIVQTITDRPPPETRRRWFKRAGQPVIRPALSGFAIEQLPKPFVPHELTEAVARALRLRAELGENAGDVELRARSFTDLTAMQREARENLHRRW